MKTFKFIAWCIVVGLAIWYLFIKPNDYIVTFKANTSPGILYKELKEWNLMHQASDSFDFALIEHKPFEFYNESIKTDNIDLEVNWTFEAINDSLSKVVVGLSERDHSIYNRLTAPFAKTLFKTESIKWIQDFKDRMAHRLTHNFKSRVVGNGVLPEMSYAYVELKNIAMSNKALEMLKNNEVLLTFVTKNNLKNGKFPFIMVEDWDIENDQIDFRYCFPIVEKDSLPFDDIVKYGKMESKPALKAVYNGNYRTSDRAWFQLNDYAERNDIETSNRPIELFFNNPFYGGDELEWVAEIYMPIK